MVKDFERGEAPFTRQYRECLKKGLITGICKACSSKTGSLESAQRQGITLLDDMSGHPSLDAFLRDGYEVLAF